MSDDKKRVHVLVGGRVQGVFFRATAREMAKSLRVKGWIKNRWDGKVEMLVEGDKEAVDKMVQWAHHGPPGAAVTDVKVKEEPFKGEFDTFSIRYQEQ